MIRRPAHAASGQSPAQAFLAPLARLAARHPGIEGEVLWAEGEGWQVQDEEAEMLDAPEIAFYAEGLLAEGFGLLWRAMAEEGARDPDHILLIVWEAGSSPVLPEPAPGWAVLAEGRWEGGK